MKKVLFMFLGIMISSLCFGKIMISNSTVEIPKTTQIIVSDQAEFYSQPNFDNTPVLYVKTGEPVIILDNYEAEWYRVLYNKKTYYTPMTNISDSCSKAIFYGNPGYFFTKTYDISIWLPKFIPAKNINQIKKTMSTDKWDYFNRYYSVDSTKKGKPYKINEDSFSNFDELIEFNSFCEKYFGESFLEEHTDIKGTMIEIYAQFTLNGQSYTTAKRIYESKILETRVYKDDFDGNSIFGMKTYENLIEGESNHTLNLYTLDKNPVTLESEIISILTQNYIQLSGMERIDYSLSFPKDFKGIHNKIHVVCNDEFHKDNYYLVYKNNHFEKESRIGIVNKENIIVRNNPSTKNAKTKELLSANTEVVIYDICGSGKLQDSMLDLWYKIYPYEEGYVNAADINLYPFFIYCYDMETKSKEAKTITGIYQNYDEAYFYYNYEYAKNEEKNGIRAQNLEWQGINASILSLFLNQLNENLITSQNLYEKRIPGNGFDSKRIADSIDSVSYIYTYGIIGINEGLFELQKMEISGQSSLIPMGITMGTDPKTINKLFGTAAETIELSGETDLIYYAAIGDSDYKLTLVFKDKILAAMKVELHYFSDPEAK